MIRPTFLSFETAKKAISNSQIGLDTVGHNISNAQTPGYTRQRIDQVSINSAGYKTKYNNFGVQFPGQGADINAISQIRDPYLDNRYRAEATIFGELGIKDSGLLDINNIFDEIQTNGLHAKMGDLYTALDKLLAQADNKNLAEIVRNTASELVGIINKNYQALVDAREMQTKDLQADVDSEVNDILAKIADLNVRIKDDHFYGNPSNELQDERNLWLDKLSEYLDINIIREPIKIGNDLVIEDLRIELKNSGNPPVELVNSGSYNNLKVDVDEVTGNVSIHLIDSVTGNKIDIRNDVTDGVVNSDLTMMLYRGGLKGYIDIINGVGPNQAGAGESTFKGIPYYKDMLDEFAAKLAEAFNRVNNITDQEAALSNGEHPATIDKNLFVPQTLGVKRPATGTDASAWIDNITAGTLEFSGRNYNIAFRAENNADYAYGFNSDANWIKGVEPSSVLANAGGSIEFDFTGDPITATVGGVAYEGTFDNGILTFVDPNNPNDTFTVSVNGDLPTDSPTVSFEPKEIVIATVDGRDYAAEFNNDGKMAFKEIITDDNGNIALGATAFNVTVGKNSDGTPKLADANSIAAGSSAVIDATVTASNISIAQSWINDSLYLTATKEKAVTVAEPKLEISGTPPSWMKAIQINKDANPPIQIPDGRYVFDDTNGVVSVSITREINGVPTTTKYIADSSVPYPWTKNTQVKFYEEGAAQGAPHAFTITTSSNVDKDTNRISLDSDDAKNILTLKNVTAAANDNIFKFKELFSENNTYDTAAFSGTFESYLIKLQGDAAQDKKMNQSKLDASYVVISSIADRRDAVSAVSVDEEGIVMMQYQNAYNAAARYMTTLDEALDKIINGMGVVGR